MSSPRASSAHERPTRVGFLRHIRLSTLLLLVPTVALFFALYTQRRRQAELQNALLIYRQPRNEAIHDALGLVIALPYADGDALDNVFKNVKGRTTGHPKLPKIPTGIPIYVDPLGLQEVQKSLSTPVKRPAGAAKLTLGEHLRQILDQFGLAYVVKDGFLLISSRESLDPPGDGEEDLYLQYRDVLR